MSPMSIVVYVAQGVRWAAWAMAVFLAVIALRILLFDAGDYPSAPEQSKAGLITLALAIGLVVLAAVMGPMVRQLSEARRF